jgi:hypothetical protein
VTIVFHAKSGEWRVASGETGTLAAGTTSIDLVPSVDPAGSGVITTQVDDAQGPMTLGPAPTDAYDPRIDGVVTLTDATGAASAAGADALSAGVADTAVPVLPRLTTSVVAVPAAPVSAGVARSASGVSQHVADGLFAILGSGAAAPAELALLGGGGDAAVPQALAAQMSGGSAQASLDNLLWESEDSSWLDGKRDWLP